MLSDRQAHPTIPSPRQGKANFGSRFFAFNLVECCKSRVGALFLKWLLGFPLLKQAVPEKINSKVCAQALSEGRRLGGGGTERHDSCHGAEAKLEARSDISPFERSLVSCSKKPLQLSRTSDPRSPRVFPVQTMEPIAPCKGNSQRL